MKYLPLFLRRSVCSCVNGSRGETPCGAVGQSPTVFSKAPKVFIHRGTQPPPLYSAYFFPRTCMNSFSGYRSAVR